MVNGKCKCSEDNLKFTTEDTESQSIIAAPHNHDRLPTASPARDQPSDGLVPLPETGLALSCGSGPA